MESIKLRNSAKAIIIKDRKLLCTKHADPWGVYYLLPGGGQNPGENIIEALKRECKEELSVAVSPYKLRFIREYIGKNHEFAEYEGDIHQIEFMFLCEIEEHTEIKMGALPDERQIGYEWLELANLRNYRIYPNKLKQVITPEGDFIGGIYLGDVN